MSWRLGSRQRWWLLAAGWALLIALGLAGFIRQADELDLDSTFLDQLYFTLQLAVLDYKGPSENINWQLQVVRFTAPLMAAGTLIQSASVVFREQFIRWRARRARDHVVVCGLGPVGRRLTEALVEAGRPVVAIVGDGTSANAATVARLDVPVVEGDAVDAGTLLAVRADRARRVVAVTANDATNIAIAATLREVDRPAGLAPLRCAVRLDDGELAHLLRTTELHGSGDVRLEFFNVQERAAHALLTEHPLVAPADRPDGTGVPAPDPHLMIIGVGQFGGEVLVAAAQRWAELDRGPLPVTLVERRASRRFHALTMRHPALAAAVHATCVDLDIGAPASSAVAEFDAALASRPPTLVVVAFEDDALAWTSALFVRRHLTRPVDIVVRTDADGGFGRHLHEADAEVARPARVVPFPFLDRSCTVDLIEGGVREQLARALHEEYVLHAPSEHSLHRPWADLSDGERESSRSAADAIVAQLASVGARLEPLRRWSDDDVPFGDDEIETLASTEHARWSRERIEQGWTWGAERDDDLRLNPLLVDWDDLPDDARERSLRTARSLPTVLARAGFEVVRVDGVAAPVDGAAQPGPV